MMKRNEIQECYLITTGDLKEIYQNPNTRENFYNNILYNK